MCLLNAGSRMQPKDLVAHGYFQTIVIKSLARMISLFLAEYELCQKIFKITY